MKSFKVIILFLIAALIFLAVESRAQESIRNQFLYDPTFWGNGLKLSYEQRKKIESINSEFYQKLRSIRQANSFNQNQLEEIIRLRSNQIIETFHNRQRRKWDKIIADFTA